MPATAKLSIYIPQTELNERPVERLTTLGEKRDRAVNCLVVEAILAYLEREEKGQMTDDRTHDPVVAAALDVLGVRALLEQDLTALAAANACDGLVGTVLEARYAYTAPDPKSDSIELYERGTYFGDSMYLFGDPSEPEQKQSAHLIVVCAMGIWSGIYASISDHRKSYAPRVGICRGNLRWREIRTSKHRLTVPIGTSMARAHLLQESQDWVGGAVSSEVAVSDQQYVVEYPVPLKSGGRWWAGSAQALNWVAIARQDDRYDLGELSADLRRHAGQQKRKDAKLKWENTLTFAEAVLS